MTLLLRCMSARMWLQFYVMERKKPLIFKIGVLMMQKKMLDRLFYPRYWQDCGNDKLTHWGRVTHICVNDLTSIGSGNGLSPGRRQAIIGTNAGILLIRPLGTNFSEFLVEILIFSFKKMRLKVSSANRRPFCLGLNELNNTRSHIMISLNWIDLKQHQTHSELHYHIKPLRIYKGFTRGPFRYPIALGLGDLYKFASSTPVKFQIEWATISSYL